MRLRSSKITPLLKTIYKLTCAVTLCLVNCLLFAGCGVYSFTGTNLDPEIKTISVASFYNDTGQGPADMSQNFTNELKDYFLQNTNLTLIDNNGDLQFEGSITGYDLVPEAPVATGTANRPDEAGLMRFVLTVKVNFINLKDDTQSFERTFSFNGATFNPRTSTLDAELPQLIDKNFENIIFDIFQASVANW